MSNNIPNDMSRQVLTKRVRCDYTMTEHNIMQLRETNVLNELEILRLTGKLVIFENQELIARRVTTCFSDKKIINVMVVSKTQSGKTGSMCATIKQYLEGTSNLIPIENIYIITGLSSCEWKDQTKERMPESIQSRVFHRCELPNTFVDEIKYKKNILIIMDEIQVAAKKGQTIYNTFENAGLLDKSSLYANDIKILEYTATPDGTIYDLMKWNEASTKILAEVGDAYTSSFDLLQMGRVKQYKDLSGYNRTTRHVDESVLENVAEIKTDVDKYSNPLYHIIRTKNGQEQNITIDRFKKTFIDDNCEFITYDRESEIEDINQTLSLKPERHTFIFIKEMLRCAKTLTKNYIGILYDRYSKYPDDTTILQGLVGRDTGYDNNGISICYTNISSIERYEQLWRSNFEDTTIRWNSKTTKYTNGVLVGINTFNDPADYDGFSVSSDDGVEIKEIFIQKCRTQQEAKSYYIRVLQPIFKERGVNGRGPNIVKPNGDGYYEVTLRSNKRVHSFEEVTHERRHGLTDNVCRLYPCYNDINDKSTLQWWVIHYVV
jgi:hypothetical protein